MLLHCPHTSSECGLINAYLFGSLLAGSDPTKLSLKPLSLPAQQARILSLSLPLQPLAERTPGRTINLDHRRGTLASSSRTLLHTRWPPLSHSTLLLWGRVSHRTWSSTEVCACVYLCVGMCEGMCACAHRCVFLPQKSRSPANPNNSHFYPTQCWVATVWDHVLLVTQVLRSKLQSLHLHSTKLSLFNTQPDPPFYMRSHTFQTDLKLFM